MRVLEIRCMVFSAGAFLLENVSFCTRVRACLFLLPLAIGSMSLQLAVYAVLL
jgi:hypothetical protein